MRLSLHGLFKADQTVLVVREYSASMGLLRKEVKDYLCYHASISPQEA